jgi:1-acyl-sn-glycerol-3-phosphate acyltransferase
MGFYAGLWQIFAFAPIKLKGAENIIKDSPFIICPNHSSFMDIPCIYAIFKRYFVFTGKKEIENWPLFHIFYTSGMNILVDRHSRSGAMASFKKMMKEIDKGNPLLIFPEGTISKTAPELTSFKSGAFKLAIQKKVPILPVTFVTNWKRLQRKGLWEGKAGPGYSEVVIHEAVYTDGLSKNDVEILETKIRKIINGPLNERYGCEI